MEQWWKAAGDERWLEEGMRMGLAWFGRWCTDGQRKRVPKGMKRILEERGLFRDGLKMECRKQWTDEKGQKHSRRGCLAGVEDCCGRRIMELQADFQEQKGMGRGGLVSDVITRSMG